MTAQRALEVFLDRVDALGWVTDVWVAGSLAGGDHRPGISDLDLVALADGPVDGGRRASLGVLHRALDVSHHAARLGCVYVNCEMLPDRQATHPTWTHRRLVDRTLSGITRAELVQFGYPIKGRNPADVLPAMTDDEVREAGRAELTGYWSAAARRPWWWLNPEIVDLGLTSMARGRYVLAHAQLLTKSDAIDLVDAPDWLRAQLHARRAGRPTSSPRVRSAWLAWRDAWRTTRVARSASRSQHDGHRRRQT